MYTIYALCDGEFVAPSETTTDLAEAWDLFSTLCENLTELREPGTTVHLTEGDAVLAETHID